MNWYCVLAFVGSVLAGLIIWPKLHKLYIRYKRKNITHGKNIIAQREWLFYTLMSTRTSCLEDKHCDALNSIMLAFHTSNKQSKEQEVINACSEYMVILGDTSIFPISSPNLWSEKAFINLLHKMSECVGYNYTRKELVNDYKRLTSVALTKQILSISPLSNL